MSPQSSPESCSIRRLPIEIRLLVFYEFFQQWPCSGKVPDLIKALRGDPELYEEALEAYYESATLLVSTANSANIAKIPRKLFLRARSLRVHYKRTTPNGILPPTLSLSRAWNVHTLHIAPNGMVWPNTSKDSWYWITRNLMPTCDVQRDPSHIFTRRHISQLPSLKSFTLELSYTVCKSKTTDAADVMCIMDRVAHIDNGTGILHQWIPCSNPSKVALRWESEPGLMLKWTDDDHLCSIPLPDCRQVRVTKKGLFNLCFNQEPYLGFRGLSPHRIWLSCPDADCDKQSFPAVCELFMVPARCELEHKGLRSTDSMAFKLAERRSKLGRYINRADMHPEFRK